jgi:hypothetical protein
MRSLIAITTCNRIEYVKMFIWNYLNAVNKNKQLHFILALDGSDPSYIDFCDKFNIPLIYSESREGVGLSKNRVLELFPDYDYYFFIDDDVELVNDDIFTGLTSIMEGLKTHHFCANERHVISHRYTFNGKEIVCSMDAGGYFTVYSSSCINAVGGWHTHFAKYKRFGHTEHSYRTIFSGLQSHPFIFAKNYFDCILLHSPPSVTQLDSSLFIDELNMIERKQSYFPLQTLSPYHFNNKPLGYNQTVADFLEANPKKYPLTKGKERRLALAEHYALCIAKKNGFLQKLGFFLLSFWYCPTNVALKHHIKTQILGKRK